MPYHGWRISHRTHHANHGHVENDESWHPVSKSIYEKMVSQSPVLAPRAAGERSRSGTVRQISQCVQSKR